MFKFYFQGHCDDVRALACHPDRPCFVTAGLDRYICKWEVNSLVWKVQSDVSFTMPYYVFKYNNYREYRRKTPQTLQSQKPESKCVRK